MSEHYLQSYGRLLDGFIGAGASLQARSPAEIIDRIDAGVVAFAQLPLERSELIALLAIAIDRLAMQGVVAG